VLPHLRDDGDHLALRPAELAKVRHHQDVIGAERREALAPSRQAAVAARPVVGEDRRAPDALEYPAMLPGRRRVVTGGSRVPDEPAAVGPFSAQGAGPRLRIRAAHAPSVQERERPFFTVRYAIEIFAMARPVAASSPFVAIIPVCLVRRGLWWAAGTC
jgi:hypothetical protein